jgi:hypothetical protein
MSKAKRIGTAAEKAVLDYLVALGFECVRPALAGSGDLGDIWATRPGLVFPKLVVQVKGGRSAETASFEQKMTWLEEAWAQATRAGSTGAVLVTKRAGYGATRVGGWRATWRPGLECSLDMYLALHGVDR